MMADKPNPDKQKPAGSPPTAATPQAAKPTETPQDPKAKISLRHLMEGQKHPRGKKRDG